MKGGNVPNIGTDNRAKAFLNRRSLTNFYIWNHIWESHGHPRKD